jgi:hypothetical protein
MTLVRNTSDGYVNQPIIGNRDTSDRQVYRPVTSNTSDGQVKLSVTGNILLPLANHY